MLKRQSKWNITTIIKRALRASRACGPSIRRETINHQGKLIRLIKREDLQGGHYN
jgi:hypothetical protein